jgi:hypothetical protein
MKKKASKIELEKVKFFGNLPYSNHNRHWDKRFECKRIKRNWINNGDSDKRIWMILIWLINVIPKLSTIKFAEED